jgi:uncharacterized membrane protein
MVASICAVSASLTLAIAQVSLGRDALNGFVFVNQLAPPLRHQIVRNVLVAVGSALVMAAAYVAVRRWKGARELSTVAACASPLAVAFALPSLLAYGVWFDRPLQHLAYLAVVVLVFERLLRRALPRFPAVVGIDRLASRLPGWLRRLAPPAIVVTAALAYAGFASYLSLVEHFRFMTGGYDLGIYDSLVSNVLAGHFFRSPVCTPDMSYLSNHAEFGIFYVAPLYALFPRSETLLIVQAFFLGLAAIPLYLFASTQVPRATAAILSLAYLLYAPMHGANFYDFHWMPMAMPFWLTLFYGLARRKLAIIIPVVILILPLREETGVLLAVLGAFLVLSRYWPRLGLVFCAVGVTYFSVMKFVFMPMAGSWWFENFYVELIAPGEKGYGSIIKTLLVNPVYVWKTLIRESKLVYALHLFAPLAFLPLRRPLLALLAAPGFFFTLLTTGYDPSVSIRFQYTSHWIPWLFASTALYLMLLGRRPDGALLRRAAVGALALGVFCHSYVYGAVLQHNTFASGFERLHFSMSDSELSDYRDFQAIAAQIPKNASVAASEDVVAHVANRVTAYTLKITHGDADYLLIHARSLNGGDRTHAEEAFSTYEYGLVDSKSGFYLFKRDYESPKTAAALAELGIRAR